MSEKVSPKFATKKRKRLNADGPKQRKKISQRDNKNNQNDSNTNSNCELLKDSNDSDMENVSAPCHDVNMCEVDVQNPELTSNKVHQVFPVDSLVDKDDAGKGENTARHQSESVHPEENEDPLFGIYEAGDNVDYAATRISDDVTIENGDDNGQNVVKHDESHDNENEPKENMPQERNDESTVQCCNQNVKGNWCSPIIDHDREILGEEALRFEDVQMTDTCITEKEDIQCLKNDHCMKTDTMKEEMQAFTTKEANDTRKNILLDEFVKDVEDKDETVDNVNNIDSGEGIRKKYEQDNKQTTFVYDDENLEEQEGKSDVVEPSISNEDVCNIMEQKVHETDDAPAERCDEDTEIVNKKESASSEKLAKTDDSPAYVPVSYEDEQKDKISQIYIESTQRFYSYEDMYSHEIQTEETFETTKLNSEESIVDGDDGVVEEDHDDQTTSQEYDNQTGSQTPATQSFSIEGSRQSYQQTQPINRTEAHEERLYQVQNSTNFSMDEIGRNILEKVSDEDGTERTYEILNSTNTEQDRSEDGALGDGICEDTAVEEAKDGMAEEQSMDMHERENEQEGKETRVKEEQRMGPQAAHSVDVKLEEEQREETLVVQRVEKQAIEEQGVEMQVLQIAEKQVKEEQGVERKAAQRTEKKVNEEKGLETQAVLRSEKQMNKEKEVEKQAKQRTEKEANDSEQRAESTCSIEHADEESIQMDITDSQLCDLDWTSISSQRTNEMDAKESSKPQLPDGTNIVKGFIKELSHLNMIILKNKRDYEYEKRRQNQLLRQQRTAQSTSRSQWNAR